MVDKSYNNACYCLDGKVFRLSKCLRTLASLSIIATGQIYLAKVNGNTTTYRGCAFMPLYRFINRMPNSS